MDRNVAVLVQQAQLLAGLDADRRHLHLEIMGYDDHPSHQSRVAPLMRYLTNEAPIDLDSRDEEMAQRTLRGSAGAEGVQC